MSNSFHSVIFKEELCIGCTHCIKKCPTEAIRVREGKAKIIASKCIDCGMCIRHCPEHAKESVTDSLDCIQAYKYKIALPAPSLYGQFGDMVDPGRVVSALKSCGFDHVFEVSRAADAVSELTKEILLISKKRPLLSSSCPVIVTLLQVRFPSLLGNIIPLESPMEIAARTAKYEAIYEMNLDPSDVGVFFISPCPAKVTDVKNSSRCAKSSVDGVISFREIHGAILANIDKYQEPQPFYMSGGGIGWARAGGETISLGIDEYICVDGVENIIKILDDIENERLPNIKFAELLACTNGCVGGVMTIENPFIARNRIRKLSEKYFVQDPSPNIKIKHQNMFIENKIQPRIIKIFGDNLSEAIKKVEEAIQIKENLPMLDCGACGSPSCQVMAEDIVLGETTLDDCMVLFKKKFAHLIEK
ncbi:iron only hydrogenase large subunit [Clostridium aceticum]|uniref:Iron only hydrogenase large subunit n=1 Tax=Clostridium aceticum TaxID=84022 RepID=A0A0G3W8F5_9CLOT|nr:[Fe-Fe] hydrogenase large subunit C-terminal domain-containing protein [Clostridium aceticum]AKL94628.1 iron only hydrogenase large subunit [Clostridium aceticum]